MIMHKMTEELEKCLPPDPAILAGVGKLIEESAREKVFVSGEGLKPTSQRVHIAYKSGQRTVTRGPFPEGRELVSGFALLRVRSTEEALGWCDEFAAAVGDMELFLGPVVEPWDLGWGPKPENAPLRFLLLPRADDRSESETPLDPKIAAKIGALLAEMTKAGVLEATGALASTKKGARIHFEADKPPAVMDGPFAESKELVAGYAILDLPSKAAAIGWAVRFGDVVKVNEVEVRQMREG
jgi:hypothetical protein